MRRRVIEVAGVLGVTPSLVLATCRDLGIGVSSPESVLDQREVDAIRQRLAGRRKEAPGRRSSIPAPPPGSARRRVSQPRWRELVEHKAQGTPVQGTVVEVVKGGLRVDAGVRAFIPASHVDTDWVEDLASFVGKTVTAMVIELDSERGSAVLSRRDAIEKRRKERSAQLRHSLVAGDECDAVAVKADGRGVLVRVDDALEVWIAPEQIPADKRGLKPREKVRITVCEVNEDQVLGSLRLVSDLVEDSKAPALGVLLERVAEQPEGPVQVVDGQLTVVVGDHDDEVESVLSAAVTMALEAGASQLQVVVAGPAKRRVRDVIQASAVRGVHPRQSRQTSGGFDLALVKEG